LLATSQISTLEYYLLLVVSDCLFNMFAATLPIGGRNSIRTLGRAMPWC